jgi:hypothetical protein
VRPGSNNAWLSSFAVGEVRYVETDLAHYPSDMRTINTPLSRRPASMEGMRFTASLFTAVSAKVAGDIRYLIAVERIE